MNVEAPALDARTGSGQRVLVVFSDGVITAGPLELEGLRESLRAAGVKRLDAVVRGGARDEAALNRWVTGLGREGIVADADVLGPVEAARRLALGTAGVIEISVPGAEWVWPTQVSGLQPGDGLTVYADIAPTAKLSVLLNGDAVGSFDERRSRGPLLQRASAQAEIAALLEEKVNSSAEERTGLIDRIVEVSIQNRVLSPHTALLVLETEEDYARFDIPRDALTHILIVEADGELGWIERAEPVLGGNEIEEAPADPDRIDDSVEEEIGESKKVWASDEAPSLDSEADEMMPPPAAPPRARAPADRRRRAQPESEPRVAEQAPHKAGPFAAWEGDYLDVQRLLAKDDLTGAERFAHDWHARAPGDPLALLALGEVWERQDRPVQAARAYGSLIDLFPSRADLRRLAGERLEVLDAAGIELAIDTFRTATTQRADHPSGHRLLAWALLKNGDHAEAIEVLRNAIQTQSFERFEAAHTILKEDASLIAAAWRATDPSAPTARALAGLGVEPAQGPSLRFILNWETDANDVDFHIYDKRNNHAYYSERTLSSGGTLYADITSGYGPECFMIQAPRAFPYTLQAHYYSRGPMGFGMGKLQVVEHDGKGGLHIEDRPFVVMTDGAFVPLGTVERSAFR